MQQNTWGKKPYWNIEVQKYLAKTLLKFWDGRPPHLTFFITLLFIPPYFWGDLSIEEEQFFQNI